MKQIYSIQDLMEKPFDDEEIEVVSKNLIYSLIVGMFNFMKFKEADNTEKIINLCCNKNDWFNDYSWTTNQRQRYKKILDKIFYNLYRFGPIKCSNSSNEFLMKYGFQVKSSNKRK